MNEAVFGLVGVFVGASLSRAKEWWTDYRGRDRQARYLAIRVVCILDRYVKNCAEVVSDDGLCEGQRDEQGCLETQVSEPPPPSYPEDVDWKSIDHGLMYRLLALPAIAEDANRRIANAFEYADPPDYDEGFEERQFQYAKLGLAAAEIAEKLRKTYRIPSHNSGDWKSLEYLTEAKERIEKTRQDRNQRAVEITLEVVP